MIMSAVRPTTEASLPPSTYPTIAARNAAFVRMMPVIRRNARLRLRHLPAAEREEAEQEIVASAFVAFARLVGRRQGHRAYATPLADFAIKGFRMGRRTSARLNRNDVTSHYCRRHSGVTMQSLQRWNEQEGQWDELLIEDRHATPADIAMLRIDFWSWLASLPRRDRWIAWLLAAGEAVRDIAQRFGVTPGRISQMRRELCDSWHLFTADLQDASPDVLAA